MVAKIMKLLNKQLQVHRDPSFNLLDVEENKNNQEDGWNPFKYYYSNFKSPATRMKTEYFIFV